MWIRHTTAMPSDSPVPPAFAAVAGIPPAIRAPRATQLHDWSSGFLHRIAGYGAGAYFRFTLFRRDTPTAMPRRFVLTFTPLGRPGYRVGEFPTEDRARDAAERHGAPPRGATPRPPLEWAPAPQFGAIMAIASSGTFVIAPA